MLGGEVVEQAPAVAEQHRNDVQFELVHKTGTKTRLRGRSAVQQNVPATGSIPRLRDAVLDVGDVPRVSRRRRVGNRTGQENTATPSW